MQIALLHYAAPPVVGGVEAVLARQAELLAGAGHAVTVLAGRGATWDARIPVRVIPGLDSLSPDILETKRSLDRGEVPPTFQPLVEALLQELRSALAGVDILIAHNVASLHKNLPLTAALYQLSQAPTCEQASPRVILWHHDLAWTAPRYQAELHPGWPWNLLRSAWPGVVQVVVSQERREELARLMDLPLDSIQVIPAGVDLPGFLRLAPSTWELASRLELASAAPLLLSPVRLTRRKNLELALRTLAALRSRLPGAMLVITGPPGAHNPANLEYLRELQALRGQLGLEGSAHLLAEGRPEGLAENEVVDLFHLADALLLPSREEGFGIPILEAGLARLPIFCSDLPTLRQLAGEWATYFSPDADPCQVADAIARRLEQDPGYQMRLRVRGSFTWQAVYARQIAPLLEAR